MAEFGEVMRQWQRMCESYKECESCPFNDTLILCDDMPWIVSDIPELEATIMKWAAEHPEPVYPTWYEYLTDMYPATWNMIKDKPLPADIAQKLGIEPKEGI